MANVTISFRHLRKTAEAIRLVSFGQKDGNEIAVAFSKGLLAELKLNKEIDSTRVELKWAALEFQRIADQDLNLSVTFDTIASEIINGYSTLIKDVICAEYQKEEVFTGLVDWLIQQVGSRASQAMTDKNLRQGKCEGKNTRGTTTH